MVTNHKPTVVDKERDKSAINKFLTKVNWGDQARQINFGYYRNALLFQPHYVLVPTSVNWTCRRANRRPGNWRSPMG